MRSKTESRRCGCGAILSLRESCARCAAAARARLHEAGVAKKERKSWQAYDNGNEVGCWFIQGFHDKQIVGVDYGDGDKGAVVTATVFPGGVYRIDDVRELPGGQYGPAKRAAVAALFRYLAMFAADMQRTDTCMCSPCMVRRLEPGWELHRGHGTTCMRERVPPADRVYYSKPLDDAKTRQSHCSHTGIEIARTCPACGMEWNAVVNQAADRMYGRAPVGDEQDLWERVNERAAALERTVEHVPQPVGAEVSWAVAKADMQCRPEARYRCCVRGYDRTYERGKGAYAWIDGALWFVEVDGRLVNSLFTESECASHRRFWQKLA